MNSILKIEIMWSLYLNGISPEEIPQQIGIHRATIYRWLSKIKKVGIRQFKKDYENAKKGRRQRAKTRGYVKSLIYEIREKKRGCCGEKVQYFLKKEYNIELSVTTIYKILRERYQLRSKWKKNCHRGEVPKPQAPREVVQVDTVMLGELYAFTSIDVFTKEVSVILRTSLESKDGEIAITEHLKRYGKPKLIQRDGGPEFKDKWQKYVRSQNIPIRTARPYKKNEQAYIERFNGILRKECVGYTKYKKKDIFELQKHLQKFLDYYHNERPHLRLNMMTPSQFAMSHLRV